jgi:hypothetical protein
MTYQEFRRRYGASGQRAATWGIAKRLLGLCALPSTQGGRLTEEEAEQWDESPGGPDCMQCSICLNVISAPDGVALPGQAASDSTAVGPCEAGDTSSIELHVPMVSRRRVASSLLAGTGSKRLARAPTTLDSAAGCISTVKRLARAHTSFDSAAGCISTAATARARYVHCSQRHSVRRAAMRPFVPQGVRGPMASTAPHVVWARLRHPPCSSHVCLGKSR